MQRNELASKRRQSAELLHAIHTPESEVPLQWLLQACATTRPRATTTDLIGLYQATTSLPTHNLEGASLVAGLPRTSLEVAAEGRRHLPLTVLDNMTGISSAALAAAAPGPSVAVSAAATSQPRTSDTTSPAGDPAVVIDTRNLARRCDAADGVGGHLPAFGPLSNLSLHPAAPGAARGQALPPPAAAAAPGGLPGTTLQLLQQLSNAGLAGFQPLGADLAAVDPTALQQSVALLAAASVPARTAGQAAAIQAASQAALLQQLQSQLFGLPAAQVSANSLSLLAQQQLNRQQQSKDSSISTQHLLPGIMQQEAPMQQQQQGPTRTMSAGSAGDGAGSRAADRRAAAVGTAPLAPSSSAGAWLGPRRPATGSAPEPALADSMHDAQRANSGTVLHTKHGQLTGNAAGAPKTDTPFKQQPRVALGNPASAPAAADGVELPAKLPAHLRKKIKIIQPISATWEQEALTSAATLKAGQQASAQAFLDTAAAGAAGTSAVPDKYECQKLIQGSAAVGGADAAVGSGGPESDEQATTSRGSAGRLNNRGSTVDIQQQPLKQPRSSGRLQRGSPDAAVITLAAVSAAAPEVACAAAGGAGTAPGAAAGSSCGGGSSGSDEGGVRASNSPKAAQGSSSTRNKSSHQQQQYLAAQAAHALSAGAAGLMATAAASPDQRDADKAGAGAAPAARKQVLPSAFVAAAAASGSKLSVSSAVAAAPDPTHHHPKVPKPAPVPAAMSRATGQSQGTAAQANAAADVGRHVMHTGRAGDTAGNKLSLASRTASQLAATAGVAGSGVGSNREAAAPGMQAGVAAASVDGALQAINRGTAVTTAAGAPGPDQTVSTGYVDDGDASSDLEAEVVSGQASSEGESEGEEQENQDQLQPGARAGAEQHQQQLPQRFPRSAKATNTTSSAGAEAAAGTEQTANGLHLTAVPAGTASPNYAAAATVSNQAAAVQAVLAAGMAGPQGIGCLSPGLGLWSHLQGSWGQLAQHDPAAAAAAAAVQAATAAPVAGMSGAAGTPSAAAGTLLGPGPAAAAAGGAGQTAAVAQLLGWNSLGASPTACVASGGYDLAGANLAAVLQQLQGPLPAMSAPAGPLNPASVSSQLGLLYSWYASNRAAYLEQVQVLLQLAERDRMMAAALGPMAASAAARPPALRALDKALAIIRGSQALEQYCRTSAATTSAATGSLGWGASVPAEAAAVAAAPVTSQSHPAGTGTAAGATPLERHGLWGSAAAATVQLANSSAADLANMFTSIPRDDVAALQGPCSAAAAAAAIAAMLQQQGSQAAAAAPGVGPASVSPMAAAAAAVLPQTPAPNPINPMAQLQQHLQHHQQQLQAPLAQMQQAVLGSGVNPLLQLAQPARIQQQQQQQQQQAAALLAPLAALAAAAGNTTAATGGVQQQFSNMLSQQAHQQLTHQQQQLAQQLGQLQAARLLCQQAAPTALPGHSPVAAAAVRGSVPSAGPKEQLTTAATAPVSSATGIPATKAGIRPASAAGVAATAAALAAAQGTVSTAKRVRVAEKAISKSADMARKRHRVDSSTAAAAGADSAALQPLPGMPSFQDGVSTPAAAHSSIGSVAAAVAAMLAHQQQQPPLGENSPAATVLHKAMTDQQAAEQQQVDSGTDAAAAAKLPENIE